MRNLFSLIIVVLLSGCSVAHYAKHAHTLSPDGECGPYALMEPSGDGHYLGCAPDGRTFEYVNFKAIVYSGDFAERFDMPTKNIVDMPEGIQAITVTIEHSGLLYDDHNVQLGLFINSNLDVAFPEYNELCGEGDVETYSLIRLTHSERKTTSTPLIRFNRYFTSDISYLGFDFGPDIFSSDNLDVYLRRPSYVDWSTGIPWVPTKLDDLIVFHIPRELLAELNKPADEAFWLNLENVGIQNEFAVSAGY